MNRFLFCCLYIIPILGFSQRDSIEYSRDYEFKEGVYLTFEDFKENNPILKKNIVTTTPTSEINFMSQVMEKKYVIYKNNQGTERKLSSDSVWGFSQNNAIYLNFNHQYCRINVVGSIFHFLAIVVSKPSFQDPMGANYALNSQEEQRQFIFDSQTNKVLDFRVKNMDVILSRDLELSAEFSKLSSRKKGDSIFIYLRKYNQKHPLYLSSIK